MVLCDGIACSVMARIDGISHLRYTKVEVRDQGPEIEIRLKHELFALAAYKTPIVFNRKLLKYMRNKLSKLKMTPSCAACVWVHYLLMSSG